MEILRHRAAHKDSEACEWSVTRAFPIGWRVRKVVVVGGGGDHRVSLNRPEEEAVNTIKL